MTPAKTADILRKFNEWRRTPSDGWREHPTSKEITAAIYAAVEIIERMEKMEAALRIAVRQNSHDMLMTGSQLRQCEAALEESK